MIECRMLNTTDLDEVVATLLRGFSDYVIDLGIDEEGFRRKIFLDGVDLNTSAGAFEDGRMVGVVINAVGVRNGLKTVYNAGTAVVPERRRKGLSMSMLNLLKHELNQKGFKRYLLEVIRENSPAVDLYLKNGFETVRNLGVFYREPHNEGELTDGKSEIKTISKIEAVEEYVFEDEGLAWQNSNDWIRNAQNSNYELVCKGYYAGDCLAGLGIIAPGSGKVLRLRVKDEFRRNGIGTLLLKNMASVSSKPLVFLNIDLEDRAAVRFIEEVGGEKRIEQFEMELFL